MSKGHIFLLAVFAGVPIHDCISVIGNGYTIPHPDQNGVSGPYYFSSFDSTKSVSEHGGNISVAEADCRSRGLELVTPQTREENQRLQKLRTQTWIGYRQTWNSESTAENTGWEYIEKDGDRHFPMPSDLADHIIADNDREKNCTLLHKSSDVYKIEAVRCDTKVIYVCGQHRKLVHYTLIVTTRNMSDAATTSDVYVNLVGTHGDSGWTLLDDNGNDELQSGELNQFHISGRSVGEAKILQVRLKGKGMHPDWRMKEASVLENTETAWRFVWQYPDHHVKPGYLFNIPVTAFAGNRVPPPYGDCEDCSNCPDNQCYKESNGFVQLPRPVNYHYECCLSD